jgi:hypothetical protein
VQRVNVCHCVKKWCDFLVKEQKVMNGASRTNGLTIR